QEEHQGLQQEIIKIPRMKIAVIGQSLFGQEVYKELRKDGHIIVGVFTIPDKDSKADPLGLLVFSAILYPGQSVPADPVGHCD
ncbi:hypothetical protein ATANTOWER_006755, partial [Ataeniobius toweri]|nr:hypothetical protein [Ataeniobius toweri]